MVDRRPRRHRARDVRLTRVYRRGAASSAASSSCDRRRSAANHIMRVLRLARRRRRSRSSMAAAASTPRASTGFGRDAVHGRRARAPRTSSANRRSQLTLVQGISRGERMDWVMQKATELGVRRIVPVFTERSVVKLDERQSERKLQHWRGIAVAACEQCGRNRVPEIAAPADFFTALRAARSARTRACCFRRPARSARGICRAPRASRC